MTVPAEAQVFPGLYRLTRFLECVDDSWKAK